MKGGGKLNITQIYDINNPGKKFKGGISMFKRNILVISITILSIIILSSGIILAEDDVLNFGWHQRPENFNVFNLIQGVQNMTARWTFSGLVAFNSEFEVISDLAESWEVDENGTVWTFHLRENVDWQDGQKFDVDDVIFTINYVFEVKGKSAESLKELVVGAAEYAEGKEEDISGIKVLDDYTIQFTTKYPTRRFLQSLTELYIVPEHVVSDIDPEIWDKSKFVTEKPYPGTGPYYVDEYRPGQYILFAKNEDYFKGEPKIDKIKLEIIKEEGVALIGLIKGNLDIASLSRDDIAKVKEEDHLKFLETLDAVIDQVGISQKAFPDKRFRQAVAYALDIDAIYSELMEELGRRQVHPWFNEKYASDNLNRYEYNPEKAEDLLDEMNWDYSREVEYMTWSPESTITAVIQQQLKEVGLDVKVLPIDGPTFIEKFYKTREWQLCWLPAGNTARPYYHLNGFYKTGNYYPGGYNAGYSNEELDELIEEAAYETDETKLTEIYKEASEILNEQVFAVPIVMEAGMWGLNKDLKISDTFNYQTWNDIQDWTLDN